MTTNTTIPATYGDAINAGYVNADTAYQRGYVSRRIDTLTAPVMVAGGSRKGQMYVLLPCQASTQYCIRQYIMPGK